MRKAFIVLAFFFTAITVSAQQKPQFSQYMINNYLLNPAITGIEDYTNAKFGYRNQWVGLEGAPVSTYFTVHGPIGKQDKVNKPVRRRRTNVAKSRGGGGGGRNGNIGNTRTGPPHHGIGGSVLFDQTGPLKTINLTGSYAFHLALSSKVKMSTGVSAGLLNFGYNPYDITTAVADDPTLFGSVISETMFDLTIGTWIYSDRFFVGASLPQIVKNRRDLSNIGNFNGEFSLQQHYYVTGGYKFILDRDYSLVPSVLVKFAQPSPVSVDLNARLFYRDVVWVGASYRRQDALVIMAGFNIGHLFEMAYSYDATTSDLNRVSAGTHEIMVGVKLFNYGKVLCPMWMW